MSISLEQATLFVGISFVFSALALMGALAACEHSRKTRAVLYRLDDQIVRHLKGGGSISWKQEESK